MVIVVQLLLALIIGAVTSGFYVGYHHSGQFGAFAVDDTALLAFCIATVVTTLIGRASPHTSPDTSSSGRPGSGTGREIGTVKWFNYSKGFGFITRASGDDVFVHYRGIRGSGRRGVQEGQRVEFVLREGDKGPQADDVVVLD